MSDFAQEMKDRTRRFAVRVLRLAGSLPKNQAGRAIGNQVLRSGTSVGANYHAAGRARSAAEFRSKLGIVEEECDETIYWLELIVDAEMLPADRITSLMKEANEILAIVVTSINTSKRNS